MGDSLDVRTNGSGGLYNLASAHSPRHDLGQAETQMLTVSSDNLVRSRHPGSSNESTREGCFKKSWSKSESSSEHIVVKKVGRKGGNVLVRWFARWGIRTDGRLRPRMTY